MRYEWPQYTIRIIRRRWRRFALPSPRAVVRDEGRGHGAEELRVQARDEAREHSSTAGYEDGGDQCFAEVDGDLMYN